MKKKQKPARKSRPAVKPKVQNERLKGWTEIASFLSQPVAVAQRWARSGMPVAREGRFMYASREELSRYLGREAGLDVPVHIATENMDLSADLKRALAHARAGKQDLKKKLSDENGGLFSPYNSRNCRPLFVPGGSAMRILVPWKPVVLVWGLLSGMILVSFVASSLLAGKDPFAPSAKKTGVAQTAQQPGHSHKAAQTPSR
jgi:hypothetical protein